MYRRIAIAISCFIAFISLAAQAQTQWWTMPGIGLGNGRFDDIYFLDPDTGLIVTPNGEIAKSYDQGSYWTVKCNAGQYVYFRSLEFLDDGSTGIAGSLSGLVYRTTNRGETWTNISGSIPDTGIFNRRICGLSHSGNTFYGVGWWGASAARFYKSTNGGQSWSTTYIDPALATSLVDVTFLNTQTGFATGCRYYDSTKQESVVLKTTDGGQSWTRVFADTTIGGRIWKIQFLDNNTGYASIEPHFYPDTVAIIKTTDGGNSWHILPIGSIGSDYYGTQGVGFITPEKGWVGGYYDGMFETVDGGQHWDYITTGNGCNRYFRVDSTRMYASGYGIFWYGHFSAAGVNESQKARGKAMNKLEPVSPNPSSGTVNISFDIGKLTNIKLEVLSLDGHRSYAVMNGYLPAGHYSYKWDCSDKPAGNYAVWLGTDEVPLVQKFTISK